MNRASSRGAEDQEESCYIWFRDKQSTEGSVARYQQYLVRRGIDDICGTTLASTSSDPFSEDHARRPAILPTASSDSFVSARSGGSGSVSYGYYQNPTHVPTDFHAATGPMVPSGLPPARGPVHDVSFLQEYNHLFTPGCKVCSLQFKRIFRDYVITAQQLATHEFSVGDFLIVVSHVETDQIDLGILVRMYSVTEYIAYKESLGRSQDREENYIGKVLRIANRMERKLLSAKFAREAELLRFAVHLQQANNLPMRVQEVELQYDGSILFIYYTSDGRVDYRHFVYDMMKECAKTRVKMKKVDNLRPFVPNQIAQIALCTGSSIK